MEKDQAFVEMVVREIVDNPEKVQTERTVDERGVLITLTVDPTDMGKLIGKEGRTAKAVRTLLRVIGAKNNARVNLKIAEPEGGTGGRKEVSYDNGEEAQPMHDQSVEQQPIARPAEQPIDVPATSPAEEGQATELI